ncbi:hypothetical protein CBM2623_A320091 [Cupriavidus taiwanensis]|nr:hypothetical protein CBM2608_A320091 [Cupriavidus taiwanensis]SPA29390.1 hypothetical protein CBM2623_A320091 [Cupriavidus taiwanensis]SPA46012.1 hypothetical protein CBM2629_A290094 [Cupriavidus taiwanensis]
MPHTARIARLQGERAVFFFCAGGAHAPARRAAGASTKARIAILNSTFPTLFPKPPEPPCA